MLVTALSNPCTKYLKERSDLIINNPKDNSVWDIIAKYNLWCPKEWDHIDLKEVIKKTKDYVSLKMYGARIHTQKIQDLPYDPSMILNEQQKLTILNYCENDLDITIDLYKKVENVIKLREQMSSEYNLNLKGDSDATIAEKLIKKALNVYNVDVEDSDFSYKLPEYIKFKTENLQLLKNNIENYVFKLDKNVKIDASPIKKLVTINNKNYQLGIGGLHSTEKNRHVLTNQEEIIIDIDVASYYPSLILNNNYYPKSFGDKFKNFYVKIYQERMDAVKNNDSFKSEVYKLLLNIPFGKYGNKYSVLYAPDMMLSITLTGQLLLLWLIERLEEYGFDVISGNTDGVTIKLDKARIELFRKVISAWENKTNLKTKETHYKAIYNQSVNSYVAVKTDDSLKLKSAFLDDSVYKNPLVGVCKKAAINYIRNCKDIKESIIECKDDFISFIGARKVEGGGYWKGEYLGKSVRWYYSKKGEYITNVKNHKISYTEGCIPIMDLSEKMIDIDYDRYVTETINLLKTVGLFGGVDKRKTKKRA